jgi:type IV pilus assembly protein PilZ
MPAKDRRKRKSSVSQERRGGRERREHTRIAMCLEVDYRCDETFLFAYITDMSAMGIFIQTTSPQPAGTLLNLRFHTQDGARMDIDGRVIWVNHPRGANSINPGMGVQFVDLQPGQRDQIMRLVRTFAYLSDDEEKIRGNS